MEFEKINLLSLREFKKSKIYVLCKLLEVNLNNQ